ncbi:hypothetical protein LRF89_09255 [Halorhodospira sp. 9621]|uniref:hypothetical protein n=1 Tax=Halorhodospira sp. 9621 TaxID=2899135 RepID=UPI001EE805A3|nr:hypothetical protein [Halorhodospira sp. 9621]MCG5533624.1 hypothetical protein [Halorhodospira sp. 9621]
MDCIFHIGLGKTATTYLQSEHFPRIGALGKRQGSRRFRRALRDVFLHEDPGYWLTQGGQSMIKRLAARKSPEEPIIYTDEALYRAPVFPRETPPVRTEQPERLVAHMEAFSNAWSSRGHTKVFFFTRNQPEWLASAYAQSSQFLPEASQADFEKRVDDILTAAGDQRQRYLDFGRLLEGLQDVLGQGAVLAMPYERMTDARIRADLQQLLGCEGFLSENTETPPAGAQCNVRRSRPDRWNLSPYKLPEGRRAHKWRKLKERLGLPAQAPTRPAAEKDIQLTAALAERIREAFEPSNRLFAERSGWSLDHLGYWPGESSAKSQEGEAGRRGA